ncbi:MAG: hypothetical protein ACJAS4_000216 [Bacteriovoracaceae bacterium]|jgi:hypothetical protein
MSIYALKTESSKFNGLAGDINTIIDVEVFDNRESILLNLHNCSGVLLDLDTETKKNEKLIQSIRKTDKDLPIIVLCNSLEGKKLQKHQASRSAADIYFTTPTDIEVIRMMMEEVYSSNNSEDTRTVALEILRDHSEKLLSSKAQIASDKLDSVFSSTFFGEYSDRKAEEMKKKKSESPAIEEIKDIDLDHTMGGLDLDDELSIGEDSTTDDDGLDLNLDDEVGLQLGDEDVEELDLDDKSSLDLGGLDQASSIDLSLGDEKGEEVDLEGLDLSGLDLGDGSIDLNLGSSELESSSEGDGLDLSLSGDDSPGEALEISLEDDEPAFSLDSSDDDSALSLDGDDEHTFSMSLGDSDEPESSEELEFGVNEEPLDMSVEIGEADSSENSNDGGISLFDDETSESQMFDLGKEDESIEEEETLDLGSIDDEISLGEDDSDDIAIGMEEEFSLSDENEDLKETNELDEFDVTRPILQSELDQIMVSEDGEGDDEAGSEVNILAGEDDDHESTIIGQSLADSDEEFSLDRVTISDDESDPLSDIQTKMLEIDAMLKGDDLGSLSKDNLPDTPLEFDNDNDNDEGDDLSELPVSFEEEIDNTPIEMQAVEVQVKASQEPREVSPSTISKSTLEEHKEYQRNHDLELVRLGETIKGLREDREKLLTKVTSLEEKFNDDKTDFIDLKAELDEKKIEIAIVKKRFSTQVDELNLKLDLLLNKKEVLQEQNNIYETEFEKLRKEKKLDINKVRSRERELEEKLDLLKNDAEVQIRNRDHKILDLKRRIDTLEFDVESSQIKERKIVTNQQAIEEKMNNVIKTLRSAIGHLEDESSLEERQRLIKKNLDV